MQPEKSYFFKKQLPELLRQLNPNQKPEWGVLNPQAMVEHLSSSWYISNGRAWVDQKTTDTEAEQYRMVLDSDEPMPPNTKNPGMPEGESPAIRKPDLASAIEMLEDEIQQFFKYFEQNPNARPAHPLFGPLSYYQWLQFQTMHIKHHLRQFNLISDETAFLSQYD